MQNRVLYIIIICFLPYICSAQETSSCAEKLKNAQTLFEKGQVEQVPSMLSQCLKSGFTRKESLLAYKLIIQAYLFEDKQETADSAMMAFLKTNPEYQISPTDHSSFVHLYSNFKVKAIVQISLNLGVNLPFVSLVTTDPAPGYPVKGNYSSSGFNYSASIEAKFEINKKMEINIEPGYSQIAFTNVVPFYNTSYYKSRIITYTENQKRIEIPVSLTYNFRSFRNYTLRTTWVWTFFPAWLKS